MNHFGKNDGLFELPEAIRIRFHIAPFPDEWQKIFQYFHELCYRDWEDIGYMMKMEDEDIAFFLNKLRPRECLHMVEFSGKLEYIVRVVRQMDVLLNTPYYFIAASFCFEEDNRDKLTEMIDVINSFAPNSGSFTSLRYEKSIAPGNAFVGLYFIADAAPWKTKGRVVSVSVNTRRDTAFDIEDVNHAIREEHFLEVYPLLTEDGKRKVREYINILLKKQKIHAGKENM